MSVTNATIGRFLAARATSGEWLDDDRDKYDDRQDEPPSGDEYRPPNEGFTVAEWKEDLKKWKATISEIEDVLRRVRNRPNLSAEDRVELERQEKDLKVQKEALKAEFEKLKRMMDALKSQTESW